MKTVRCEFPLSTVSFLGNNMSLKGVKMKKLKVETVRAAPNAGGVPGPDGQFHHSPTITPDSDTSKPLLALEEGGPYLTAAGVPTQNAPMRRFTRTERNYDLRERQVYSAHCQCQRPWTHIAITPPSDGDTVVLVEKSKHPTFFKNKFIVKEYETTTGHLSQWLSTRSAVRSDDGAQSFTFLCM
ncbi:hypothetical protein DPEC_G00209390 [Dallia pectoralis]|uniref:Uncharacterized protein n=1 Tax=Dallia pectoralis TaxID=75939 RepID=A0ACC2G5G7_DALPE|nr:hypothetical protein DPEC_G00209390 [Dallia pectoralis]